MLIFNSIFHIFQSLMDGSDADLIKKMKDTIFLWVNAAVGIVSGIALAVAALKTIILFFSAASFKKKGDEVSYNDKHLQMYSWLKYLGLTIVAIIAIFAIGEPLLLHFFH